MCVEVFDINNSEHLDRTKYKVIAWDTTGRRPSTVAFCESFKEDAARRDFSFNAMALTSSGKIIDYFNGATDMNNCIVRTVGCPYDRFGEDVLRIIRAIRFACKFDFEIEKCTAMAALDCSDFIEKVSIERIVNELFKMASLGGKKFARAIELLDEFNILDKFLPEITCMKNYLHAPIHHPEGAQAIRKSDGKVFEYVNSIHKDNDEFIIEFGSVWDHTIEAVKQSEYTDPEINLTILFHDIGKPCSFVKKYDKKLNIYKYAYHGHDINGVHIFNTVADRLKLCNDFRDKVNFCIVNHMKAHLLTKMKKSKSAKVMLHKYWPILKIVSYCDDASRKDAFNKDSWIAIENTLDELQRELTMQFDAFKYVNGFNVMRICNITTGPLVGKIIEKVKEHAVNNNITDDVFLEKLIKTIGDSIK